jgi:hypothetical protein
MSIAVFGSINLGTSPICVEMLSLVLSPLIMMNCLPPTPPTHQAGFSSCFKADRETRQTAGS